MSDTSTNEIFLTLKEPPVIPEPAPGLMSNSELESGKDFVGCPWIVEDLNIPALPYLTYRRPPWAPLFDPPAPVLPEDINPIETQLEDATDHQTFGSFNSDWMLWNKHELEWQGTKKLSDVIILSNYASLARWLSTTHHILQVRIRALLSQFHTAAALFSQCQIATTHTSIATAQVQIMEVAVN